jgi:peptidoglycan/LPS O-acetylase OafA/YrhL
VKRQSYAALFATVAAVCLLFGLLLSAYNGYSEDGCNPVTTWPYGITAFLLAGVAAILAIRNRRPNLSRAQWVRVLIALTSVLCVSAALSLSAFSDNPC